MTDAGTSSARADVVVIGAGVIGCAVALELARRGDQVVVVDKGPAAGAGSTSSSSAVVRFNYSTLENVKLSWESAQLWRRWADHLGVTDEAGMAQMITSGMLVLDSPLTRLDSVRGHFDAVGIPYEELSPDELRHRFPGLDRGRYFPPKPIADDAFWADADGELGGYLCPDAGFVDDPALAAHNLMVAAQQHGATFRFRAEVVSVDQRDGRVRGVTLASGERCAAPVVVNVAGPHSSHINGLAQLPPAGVQTRPLRQEVDVLPCPVDFRLEAGGMMVADTDLGTYIRPHPGGTLVLGGTEPECDELEWVADADVFDELPTVEIWERQTTRVARRLPNLGVPSRPTGLAALYDVSDDWVPIYDRTDLPGFYVAIGTSGNQFKNAPMVGILMAELIRACVAGRDHDADPLTITGPVTGNVIDVGHFSRRRTVHQTSNSVLG
ncbi:MAG TPA: FAD-dependent oxidoreductase [Ilumatobacteraceae bacterium]